MLCHINLHDPTFSSPYYEDVNILKDTSTYTQHNLCLIRAEKTSENRSYKG